MPGHELSGVVTELGYGTTGLTVGQRVFGLADWARDGSLAEYTAVEARNLAPLPADIDHTVAAAVPISGLTAWQGLFDHAAQDRPDHPDPRRGGRRRVDRGATRPRAGRPRDRHRPCRGPGDCTRAGCGRVVDLQADRLEEVGEVDVVFDVIGGEVLEGSACSSAPAETLVTIVGPPKVRPADGRVIFFVVEPDRFRLADLAERVRSGRRSRSSGQYGRSPRCHPHSRPTTGCPARRYPGHGRWIADPVGLDYWIWLGQPAGLGSSLSDLFGRLPARSSSARLSGDTGPA